MDGAFLLFLHFQFHYILDYCVYTKNTLLHAADCNASFVSAAIYSILSKTPRDPFAIFPRLVIGERLLLLLLARAVVSFVRVSCVRFTRSRFFKRATDSWGSPGAWEQLGLLRCAACAACAASCTKHVFESLTALVLTVA
jgi:hypothetical protein